MTYCSRGLLSISLTPCIQLAGRSVPTATERGIDAVRTLPEIWGYFDTSHRSIAGSRTSLVCTTLRRGPKSMLGAASHRPVLNLSVIATSQGTGAVVPTRLGALPNQPSYCGYLGNLHMRILVSFLKLTRFSYIGPWNWALASFTLAEYLVSGRTTSQSRFIFDVSTRRCDNDNVWRVGILLNKVYIDSDATTIAPLEYILYPACGGRS